MNYDALIIPGGGLTDDGNLPLWVQARVQRALEMQEQTRYFITLSGGTVHKPPPLDGQGFPIYESTVAARMLLAHGIAPHRILYETVSLDTIGNAFFALLLHVRPLGLKNLLIITSAFHLPRTEAIFRWIFGLDGNKDAYHLTFEVVENIGLNDGVLTARKAREVQSLALLSTTMQTINTFIDMHAWLYSQHEAYALAREPQREQGTAQASY